MKKPPSSASGLVNITDVIFDLGFEDAALIAFDEDEDKDLLVFDFDKDEEEISSLEVSDIE